MWKFRKKIKLVKYIKNVKITQKKKKFLNIYIKNYTAPPKKK